MPPLGAHLSIAGGYYRAVEAAGALGMDCVQLFTKNNNQWRAKPLTQGDVDRFRAALAATGVRLPLAHDSYLINLASPDDALWRKSLDSFVMELERAERLGLWGLVLHPGAHLGAGEEAGIARVAGALNEAHVRTPGYRVLTVLEHTAGQGSNLGWRFEHLAAIIERVKTRRRMGVCLDTCHLFAAGYALAPARAYRATMREFDRVVGLAWLRAIHLNDSKRPFGSRVDRHEHIGRGRLGLEAFRLILNDERFAQTPMYIETPKGIENGENLDAANLRVLRKLLGRWKRARPRA